MKKLKLIVGMSGASGVIYGARLLEVLHDQPDVETHLVLSNPARRILLAEAPHWAAERLIALADYSYPIEDIGARIASGSFKCHGMVVAPCSARTLSVIATSNSDNLLVRACDVMLKERRRLVLVFRETPLHLGHIRNMERATEMGAILLPPVPAFYHQPQTIDDIVNQTVGKVLDIFDIEHNLFERWDG